MLLANSDVVICLERPACLHILLSLKTPLSASASWPGFLALYHHADTSRLVNVPSVPFRNTTPIIWTLGFVLRALHVIETRVLDLLYTLAAAFCPGGFSRISRIQ